MWEALLYTMPNTSVIMNNYYNGVEIPDKMNQIINYDRHGKCVEFANNKRIFSCGLAAGVMSSTSLFFKYVPEIPNIQPTDLSIIQKPPQTSSLHISDITNMNTFNFNLNNIVKEQDNYNKANGQTTTTTTTPLCSLSTDNDNTYVVKM